MRPELAKTSDQSSSSRCADGDRLVVEDPEEVGCDRVGVVAKLGQRSPRPSHQPQRLALRQRPQVVPEVAGDLAVLQNRVAAIENEEHPDVVRRQLIDRDLELVVDRLDGSLRLNAACELPMIRPKAGEDRLEARLRPVRSPARSCPEGRAASRGGQPQLNALDPP